MRALGIFFFLAIIVLLVGALMGWWSFTTDTDAATNEREVAFEVDGDEIERDVDSARRKIDEIGEDDEAVGGEPVEASARADFVVDLQGVVESTRTSPPALVVRSDDGTSVEVALAEDATIELEGESVSVDHVSAGDRVEIDLAAGSKTRAERVRVYP